jgi:RNA polymerase sigma-70 factor (ECF subfamily)
MYLAARHHYGSFELEGSQAKQLAGPSLPDYDRSVEGLFGREGWREAVATLTTDQWETLRLHFFEGFTLVEISEKRGQPLGNVRHHYYRGLDKLRRHMLEKGWVAAG